jgi:tetratricopeptide (TPR) repeat protein
MRLIGRFQPPGNLLFVRKEISRCRYIFYLICCNVCLVYPQQTELRKIEELLKENKTYSDFETVRRRSDEIIQLAGKINRFDLHVAGIYQFCWTADYHKRMPEFLAYLQSGRKIMAERASELERLDTFGIHRAFMIHAGGMYYYALGNYEKALDEFSTIITTNLCKDSMVLNSLYSYMGQSCFNMGRLDKSFQYFELAKKYQSDDEYSVGLDYLYQVQYLNSVGKTKEAFALLHQAFLKFKKNIAHPQVRNALKSNYLLNANIFQQLEEYDSAKFYTHKSYNILSELGLL